MATQKDKDLKIMQKIKHKHHIGSSSTVLLLQQRYSAIALFYLCWCKNVRSFDSKLHHLTYNRSLAY